MSLFKFKRTIVSEDQRAMLDRQASRKGSRLGGCICNLIYLLIVWWVITKASWYFLLAPQVDQDIEFLHSRVQHLEERLEHLEDRAVKVSRF